MATVHAYHSLLAIPGMVVDGHGNIHMPGWERDKGPRQEFEFLASLPAEQLRGRVLSDMLDWCRWGAIEGVMWEATLSELREFIARWEDANTEAGRRLYQTGDIQREPLSWEAIGRCMEKGEEGHGWKCVCGHGFRDSLLSMPYQCPKCKSRKIERASFGPRGLGTYNLTLVGADGHALAGACFVTPRTQRVTPIQLR